MRRWSDHKRRCFWLCICVERLSTYYSQWWLRFFNVLDGWKICKCITKIELVKVIRLFLLQPMTRTGLLWKQRGRDEGIQSIIRRFLIHTRDGNKWPGGLCIYSLLSFSRAMYIYGINYFSRDRVWRVACIRSPPEQRHWWSQWLWAMRMIGEGHSLPSLKSPLYHF